MMIINDLFFFFYKNLLDDRMWFNLVIGRMKWHFLSDLSRVPLDNFLQLQLTNQ